MERSQDATVIFCLKSPLCVFSLFFLSTYSSLDQWSHNVIDNAEKIFNHIYLQEKLWYTPLVIFIV